MRAWVVLPDGGIVQNAVIADMDNDGSLSSSCGGQDCDDSNPNVNALLDEVCDPLDLDEDCNPCTVGTISSRTNSGDDDRDGFFSVSCKNVVASVQPLDCGLRGNRPEPIRLRMLATTTVVEGTDCNDNANDVNPLASESCNGVDDDCDGLVDETVSRAHFLDGDLDGHGAGPPVQLCPGVQGYSTLSNDCDDGNPAIKPGALVCEASPVSSAGARLCQSDGGFASVTCAGQGQCVPQPNGTGVCF